MKIILQGTNLEVSDEIRDLVVEKIGSLDRLMQRWDPEAIEVRVEVARPKEFNKGPTAGGVDNSSVYYAEANLVVPGAVLRAETTNRSLSGGLAEIRDELERQIKRHKSRREGAEKSRRSSSAWR